VLRKHKNKILAGGIIVAILAAAFFMGGRSDGRLDNADLRTVATGTGQGQAQGMAPPGTEAVGFASGTGGALGEDPAALNEGALGGDESQDGDAQTPQQRQDLPGQSSMGQEGNTGSSAPGVEQGNTLPENLQTTSAPEGSAGSGASASAPEGSAGSGASASVPPGIAGSGASASVPSGSAGSGASTAAPDGEQQGSAQPPDGGERELTVTLVISVAAILDNMDKLPDGKAELVPDNGVIYNSQAVFYEGESVFNVLQRETRKNKIHMESVNTPIYNSAYIEGINNIYEFDVGERSGWMYSVNGVFPNFGSSRYTLQDGDVVRWLYTCDRGADIGAGDAAGFYKF